MDIVEDIQENYATGWVKLYRSFLNWEWYSDGNTVRLFIHLLLKANHKNSRWRGQDIERGQLVTGLYSLNEETNLSIQSLRTSLNKLKSSKEITIKSTSKYSIITICNYDSYQRNDTAINNQSNKRATNEQQTTNKQATTNKNDNNIKNDNNNTGIEFSEFWDLYGKKVGDKDKCEKKWNSLKDSDRERILKTLPIFKAQFKDKQFQPYPYTYLNQKRWNDEFPPLKADKPHHHHAIV